jgi:hypothetical protein
MGFLFLIGSAELGEHGTGGVGKVGVEALPGERS